MKMMKFKFILLLSFIPVLVFSQSLDCPSRLKMRQPTSPYHINDLSKSAQCLTGKKYEFVVTLTQGKDYRLSFYASPVFNNNIHFRIIDMNSGQKVLDLPGQSESELKGTSVLRDYFDEKKNKMIHPYFDFYPTSSTNLKIIIDVAEAEQNKTEENSSAPKIRNKGCVTVFIQDKKAESVGF